MNFRLPCISVLISVFGLCCPANEAGAKDYALLVGVSEYPMLPKENWLQGPVNDVKLVDELLQSRFDFDKENIQKLSGWPEDESLRPTKSNIKAMFEKIGGLVKTGDSVFILMSGHGSQQPANANTADLEPDGFDEIFLPADTSKWDEVSKSVKGAIVDDEIKDWTQKIRQKGAFIWIIFDSCHSGTMTRGTAHEGRRNRRVAPGDLIPKEALASRTAASRGGAGITEAPSFVDAKSDGKLGGIVAMYAAQSIEPTFELPLPPDGKEFHGLFTFTMAQILNGTDKPISYRDLAETIGIVYRSNGILQPTPLVEGTGLDREILGKKEFKNRPSLTLTGQFWPPSYFQIDGGYLQGLRKGSVVEIYPPALADKSDLPIGTAIVKDAMATSALVSPEKWSGIAAVPVEKLTAGCRAKIVYEKMALDRLNVAVQIEKDDEFSTVEEKDLPEASQAFLKAARDSRSHWEWSDSLNGADWILRFAKDKVILLPVSGWSKAFKSSDDNSTDTSTGKPEFEVSTGRDAKIALGRIARARQLLHIGGADQKGRGAKMKVSLIRYEDSDDTKGKEVPYEASGKMLTSGDEIAFRIENTDRTSIDVTLLFVDSEFGITSIFPESGTVDDNRIPPGGTLVTPKLEVTAQTDGPEQMVALGVRSSRDRVDFSCLEQQSLERTRGAPSLDTALGQLLKGAVFEGGETRGLKRAASEDHAAKLISWWTIPKKD